MSNTDSKFAAAKERRRKEREREQSRRNFSGSGEYEDIHYTALDTSQEKIVRIIGNPWEDEESDNPWDAEHFWVSMIADDNGGKFRCIWPDEDDQPGWPLWEIYNMVMATHWVNDGGKRKRVFSNENSHPTSFRIVGYNNNEDNPYESGWKPSEMVALNVIDRHDMDWHRENKHTKILSKKASQNKQSGQVYFEPGIPAMAYNQIIDQVVEFWDDWHGYDIAIFKKSAMPWYEASHAIHDLVKLSPEVKSFVVDGPLTEEELSWERYNLDKLYKVTSMMKVESRAIKQIRKIDAEFDTDYATMIRDLAADERKEIQANQKSESKETAPKAQGADVSPSEEEDIDDELTVDEEPEERQPKKEKKAPEREEIPWDKLADGSYNGTKYEGVPYLTDEEKSMVLRVKEDGQFEYVKEWEGQPVKLYKNKESGFTSPGQFHIDPLNADEFD